MYAHIFGDKGLYERDPAWAKLDQPDSTGFCGLTCTSTIEVFCGPEYFNEEGFCLRLLSKATGTFLNVPCESDVVRIDSAPDNEHGCHSAILTFDDDQVIIPVLILARSCIARACVSFVRLCLLVFEMFMGTKTRTKIRKKIF
jgi:hypothetical protein